MFITDTEVKVTVNLQQLLLLRFSFHAPLPLLTLASSWMVYADMIDRPANATLPQRRSRLEEYEVPHYRFIHLC